MKCQFHSSHLLELSCLYYRNGNTENSVVVSAPVLLGQRGFNVSIKPCLYLCSSQYF